MAISEKITAFIDEYNTKLQNMSQKLADAQKQVDDLQLEINFINVKELPAAIERRVLSGEAANEQKLRKSLVKLNDELQSNQEVVLVLANALHRLKAEA